MRDNPGGGESDPTEGVRRRCMKNSPSVLSYIDEDKRRLNLAGEGVVRKISSPQRVASVSNLCNGQSQWVGNMGNGECCSGFGKKVNG